MLNIKESCSMIGFPGGLRENPLRVQKMRKLAWFLALILMLTNLVFPISTLAAGPNPPQATEEFSVGKVWVKYVTGTEQHPDLRLGAMGCLETDASDLNLVFLQTKESWLRRFRQRIIHLVVPSWGKGP